MIDSTHQCIRNNLLMNCFRAIFIGVPHSNHLYQIIEKAPPYFIAFLYTQQHKYIYIYMYISLEEHIFSNNKRKALFNHMQIQVVYSLSPDL